jgi:hypothetical protein
MAKRELKDKEGNVRAIELTDEDAEKLIKKAEEEAKKNDQIPCECAGDSPKGFAMVPHRLQENGKWKCSSCGNEKDEFDVDVLKGEAWFDREEGFEKAIGKVLGDFESMS